MKAFKKSTIMTSTTRIGFANQFFTVWNIDSSIEYSGTRPYQKTVYQYIQNLSKSEAKAIEKSKDFGVTDFEVDFELKGITRSFETTKKLFSDMPNNLSPFYEFGKYAGGLITEATDFKYLQWYFSETENRYAKQVLLDNGFVVYKGDLMTEERRTELKQRNSLKNNIEKGSGHHFEDGEKVELTVKMIEEFGFEGAYGYCTIQSFITSEGLVFKYLGSSPKSFDDGKKYLIKATVKHTKRVVDVDFDGNEIIELSTKLLRIKIQK